MTRQKWCIVQLNFAKSEGYTVNVHYVELDRNKALGRMLNRFIEDGRFLDPTLVDKYDNERQGNRIKQCYETLKANADLIDGYSKWDNDVLRGERPILLESQSLMGEFITNARRLTTEVNFETMKGESDYERNDKRNFKGSTIDSRDNGEGGRIRTQSSSSDFKRGRKEYDNTGISEGNGQVLQLDADVQKLKNSSFLGRKAESLGKKFKESWEQNNFKKEKSEQKRNERN